MAINLYEPTVNPVTGETFRCLSLTDEAYVMQWTVQPQGYVPFEHIHYFQDEIFEVKKGEMRILMDGKEYFAKAGDKIVVPKGKRHIAYNNREEVLDCVVTYEPSLDSAIFMQCFSGLIQDGSYDKNGGPDIPKLGYIIADKKLKCITRPTAIPAPVFGISLKVFQLMGKLAGWNKLYQKYTGLSA